MYSTKDAELPKLNELLEEVDEYDIYSYYMGSFKVGHLYNSPIRKDRNPSFAVFKGRHGNLMFKDHGTGDCGNAFSFMKLMSGYTDNTRLVKELLKIKSSKVETTRKVTKVITTDNETDIGIVRQNLTEYDKQYWNTFHISTNTLKKFDVFSIKYYLCNGIVKGIYSYDNPMFAYKVYDKFKIYRPLANKYSKWRSNLDNNHVQGLAQIPQLGSTLIITKSLKDVMVLYEMGITAISPSSETTFIPDDILDDLRKKWTHIYILYDRDKTGIKQARSYSKKYKLDAFFINKKFNAKDISDAVKLNGFTKVKNWLLKELK